MQRKAVNNMNVNILQLILFSLSIFLCVNSFADNKVPQIVFAVTVLWLISIISCVINFKEKMFCFWLELTIGVFLIGRPLILTLKGEKWWNMNWLEQEDIIRALLIIALSLGAIYIGMNIAAFKSKAGYVSEEKDENKEMFQMYLQAVSMVAFYITALFFIAGGIEKVLFCQSHSYLEYYSSFESRLPWFVGTIGSLMKYCLCIFLATWPRKRRAFLALAFFEITALFDLYVGIRGTIVLHSIFIVVYYLLRDIKGDEEKWFGRAEKWLIIVGTPIMMAFMVAYASIRSGLRVLDFSFLESIKDFFVSQGVSFEVVARGVSVASELPQRAGRNYTFGTMIDYIVHGRIGQLLLGTEALPEGNNIVNGTESNSLAHNLSYLTRGDEYLRGQGWGSSYVLENYIDFHFIGVVLFSLLLGFFLVKALQWFGKKRMGDTIILVSLLNIFYIPRAEATGWLSFIITLQFWLCMGCCYFCAYVSSRNKSIGKILVFLNLFPKSETCKKKKNHYTNIIKERNIREVLVVILCTIILAFYVTNEYEERNKLEGVVECNFTGGAVYEGQLVRIYAKVEGKGEDYKFQFCEVYDGKEKVVQEYGEKNGYAFEASGLGEHIFYIDVQNEEGQKGVLTFKVDVKERP